MKTAKFYLWSIVALMAALLSTACTPEEEPQNPMKLELKFLHADAYSADFSISTHGATEGAWVCIEADEATPTPEEILAEGKAIDVEGGNYNERAEELLPESDYRIIAYITDGEWHSTEEMEFTTAAATAPEESHALIVFMQGDNGLAEFMDTNLQNIITAYYNVPEGAQVIIFYDRGNYTRLTELYMSDGMVKQRLLKEYSRAASSVDPEFMRGVFELIQQEVEADSYGMILSSHGGGWVPGDIYKYYLNYDWYSMVGTAPQYMTSAPNHTTVTKFYGQDGSDYLDVDTLAGIIDLFHYDYIIFDACFMSNVEALYDLRNNADYIIASSAEVLGNGFPYTTMIPLLFRPDHGLRLTCKAYMELFEDSSGTISMVDCSELDGLAEAMRKVVATSDGTVDASQIQGYDGYPIHLYYDLEQHVEQLTDDATLRGEFRDALQSAVVYTNHTPTYFSALYGQQTLDLPRSCGLTCHVERAEFPDTHAAYLQTAWAKAIGIE